MPWLKLDDAFFDHEKILDRSKDAKLLHLAALTYCAARSPHGVLSPAAVRVCAAKVDIPYPQEVVTELLWATLWETVPPDSPLQPVPSGSYQIHDFNDYNPTPEQVAAQRDARREEDRRRADAERQRNKRERDRHGESVTEGVTCHENNVTESVTPTVTCHAPSRGPAGSRVPVPLPVPLSPTPAPDIIPQTPTKIGRMMTTKGAGVDRSSPEVRYPLGWEDAEKLSPSALLARYREIEGEAGEARLATWLAAARKTVHSQPAYLRPCILGWLRGDDPDPIAVPPTTGMPSPTRSINAAAAARAEALRAEHGSVAAALTPPRKANS